MSLSGKNSVMWPFFGALSGSPNERIVIPYSVVLEEDILDFVLSIQRKLCNLG